MGHMRCYTATFLLVTVTAEDSRSFDTVTFVVEPPRRRVVEALSESSRQQTFASRKSTSFFVPMLVAKPPEKSVRVSHKFAHTHAIALQTAPGARFASEHRHGLRPRL